MQEKEQLLSLLDSFMLQKGLHTIKVYTDRLSSEVKEIDAQNEHQYFLDLYRNKTRFPKNQHNLLVPYLLGVVDEIDISKPPTYIYGEFPDIDVDYLPSVRDYLKNEWAPKEFGGECTSNICSYNTFGIKSSLIDMARVYGKDRSEILDLTTQLGLKDEEGKVLTWDKALEIYPALKKYCDENPDVAEAAKKLLFRNKSMGKHAGGLIVSSTRIDNFVPLVKDKEGIALSSWVEGLHGQDLGPMGLVKFDLLVITNLMQIAHACRLIKERHGLQSICALPGQKDWSDTSYLNDPKALKMASDGDLKCIFQFDSEGIRQLAVAGGVDSFEDLVAYTALYRPGPLGMKMHERYIERKRGREEYDIHPVLQPILGVTYNVLAYQEQVMQALNVVGEIPLKDCEIVRKAISKKKIELFSKYKEMFVKNGQRVLGWTEEKVVDFWNQIEAFAEYGFNRSHACAYTYISSRLLWLKAHYPLEFFAAIFSCEDQSEKLREYKLEAEKHGIPVMPVDINKSGVRFKIVDGEPTKPDGVIYFGLANVKGIGEAVAERIVSHQPYKDFKDFLTRFGTDASVMKPLLGLRVFLRDKKAATGADVILLYKYYEWFKDIKKKREDSNKRFEKRVSELTESLKNVLPDSCQDLANFEPGSLEEFKRRCEQNPDLVEQWQDQDGMEHNTLLDVENIHKSYQRSMSTRTKKLEAVADNPEEKFDPNYIKLDEKLAAIYSSLEESEKAYYGFLWRHPLERSPDYNGNMTFENARQNNSPDPWRRVEVYILSAEKKISQKKTEYWLLKVEDTNSEPAWVQVWSDDWERWNEELAEGNLVKMDLRPPEGYKRWTLYSPPKHLRSKVIGPKSSDFRVFLMRKGSDE